MRLDGKATILLKKLLSVLDKPRISKKIKDNMKKEIRDLLLSEKPISTEPLSNGTKSISTYTAVKHPKPSSHSSLEKKPIETRWTKWVKKINLEKSLELSRFHISGNFKKVGDITLTKNKRTLWEVSNIGDKEVYEKRQNGVYIICINNKIVKIGGTKTGIKQRINSYLCGHCIPERRNAKGRFYPGKMSVTNAFVYNTLYYQLLKENRVELLFYPIRDNIVHVDIWGKKELNCVQNYDLFEKEAIDLYCKLATEKPDLCNNSHP